MPVSTEGSAEAARLARVGRTSTRARGTPRPSVSAVLARTETMLGGGAEAAVRILDSVLARHPLDSVTPINRPYTRLASEYARAGARSGAKP